jgi:hypothetical protein
MWQALRKFEVNWETASDANFIEHGAQLFLGRETTRRG